MILQMSLKELDSLRKIIKAWSNGLEFLKMKSLWCRNCMRNCMKWNLRSHNWIFKSNRWLNSFKRWWRKMEIIAIWPLKILGYLANWDSSRKLWFWSHLKKERLWYPINKKMRIRHHSNWKSLNLKEKAFSKCSLILIKLSDFKWKNEF